MDGVLSGHNMHITAVLCAALGIIIYINSLDCGLCFDDMSAISRNLDLHPETPWKNLIWNDFWGTPMEKEGSHKSYRPLCVATFRLNYLFHGLQPFGYHLVNILLHGVVCYVFVVVCGTVVFSSNKPALWITGLCFAVHPTHTEAVAGVVGRAECLSALFFLMSFYSYSKCIQMRSRTAGQFLWILKCLLFCICSVLSKEQGITVIAVCISYEFFIIHKNTLRSCSSIIRGLFKGQIPPWLKSFLLNVTIMIGFLVLVMIIRVKIMKAELPVFTVHDNPAVSLGTPYRQLHWLYLIFQNAWLLLNPSHLCADWTMGTIPLIESISDSRNILTLLTFSFITVLGIYSIKDSHADNQAVLFGLSLIAFPFLPASNLLFPVGFVVAERILYVPSMGYAILVGIGFDKLLRRRSEIIKLLVKFGLCFVIVVHCVKTMERNRDWQSATTLFSAGIRVNPLNGKLYNNLGHEYEQAGNQTYAEDLFRKAIEYQSDDIGAYINLGRILNAQDRVTEAEDAYHKAIDLMPTGKSFRVAPPHINVYFNLANLVKRDPNRVEEAYKLYKTAISMKPDFVEAYVNQGDLLLKVNKTEEAKLAFMNAVKYKPDYADAHFNLATTYLQLGDTSEAAKSYRTALSADKDHTLSLFNLAILLSETKSKESLNEAKELFNRLLLIQPSNDKAYFQIGLIHSELGDIESAKKAFQKALYITPTYRTALYNFAFLSYQTKEVEKAFNALLTLKQHHPDHSNGMQLLGDCYMQFEQLEEAIETYKLSIHYNPNHVTAIHNLGVAMTKKQNFKEALKLFSRALQLNPEHGPSQKHYSALQKQLQQRQQKTSSK